MLYANTDDGSSALWVLDDDGVVIDNISIYGAERAPILEQINEHYGTSFTGWSDNEIGLRFGDPLPNWNAYEKIELPEIIYINLQANSGNTGSFAGFILGNKFHWYSQNNGSKIIIVSNATYNIGTIVALIDWEQTLENNVLQAIRNNYPNVDDIETYDVTWSQGDIVPNWETYNYIPR